MEKFVKLYAACKAGCLGSNIFDAYSPYIANIIVDENMKVINENDLVRLFNKKYRNYPFT